MHRTHDVVVGRERTGHVQRIGGTISPHEIVLESPEDRAIVNDNPVLVTVERIVCDSIAGRRTVASCKHSVPIVIRDVFVYLVSGLQMKGPNLIVVDRYSPTPLVRRVTPSIIGKVVIPH